jgi:hypothetical protein
VRRILAALLLLGGCSSAPRASPEDSTLARFDHAGGIAFGLEQPDQAATHYREALARARTRDDAGAIADAGFNLATAQLRAGHPRDAIGTVQELRTELARRGIVDPGLDLISATALFRLNDLSAADRAAVELTRGDNAELANAAWFLRGLIADMRRDRLGLERAAASMTKAANAADVGELQARLSHNPQPAMHAADLRREDLDYRGMARALALAAQWTPDASEAADLYLRAGRSAAAQGDVTNARLWLSEARKRSPDTGLRSIVDQALHDLPGQAASHSSVDRRPRP